MKASLQLITTLQYITHQPVTRSCTSDHNYLDWANKIPALEFGSELHVWAGSRWGNVCIEWIYQAASSVQSVDQDYNNSHLTCHFCQSLTNAAWRMEIKPYLRGKKMTFQICYKYKLGFSPLSWWGIPRPTLVYYDNIETWSCVRNEFQNECWQVWTLPWGYLERNEVYNFDCPQSVRGEIKFKCMRFCCFVSSMAAKPSLHVVSLTHIWYADLDMSWCVKIIPLKIFIWIFFFTWIWIGKKAEQGMLPSELVLKCVNNHWL